MYLVLLQQEAVLKVFGIVYPDWLSYYIWVNCFEVAYSKQFNMQSQTPIKMHKNLSVPDLEA